MSKYEQEAQINLLERSMSQFQPGSGRSPDPGMFLTSSTILFSDTNGTVPSVEADESSDDDDDSEESEEE
jgi:bromodomain-containing factor 1